MSDRPNVDRRPAVSAEAVDRDASSTARSNRAGALFFCIVVLAAIVVTRALDLGVIMSALLGAAAIALSIGFDRWRVR